MSWGVLNAAMLIGVLGAGVPVAIHLLNRSRDPIVEWGAMQFLALGRKARQKIRLNEMLLMMARMALLAVVAIALARPYSTGGGAIAGAVGGPARDVVLVLDGSSVMDRKSGGTTPKAQAIAWARKFVNTLGSADSVALLVASDRVRAIVDPPSFDKSKIVAALKAIEETPARGSGDIPSSLASSFRILERTKNPARDVVILTEGHRGPWHAGDPARWSLLRDLHKRLPIPPRIWSIAFDPKNSDPTQSLPNGSIGPLSVSRALVTPEMPITISADFTNSGPGPLARTVELLVDGKPVGGQARVIGPVAEKEKLALEFKTTLRTVGSHLLTIRLVGNEDALPSDDESSIAIEVAPALGVLLVDGEPSSEPFGSETDFLRAALAPTGDDTPRAKASVVSLEKFSGKSLLGQSVLILANVERLSMDQAASVEAFLFDGGGVMVAPGDRTDAPAFNASSWLPAKFGDRTGDFAARKSVAHPSPSSFSGTVLAPFAKGESPALAEADLFGYWRLEPVPGASVAARLDTAEPWAVERSHGKGRVLLLAGPLDAEGGTLPVNPDFVPLMHEWAFSLASGREARSVKPGEPLVFELNPPPATDVRSLPILMPSGLEGQAIVTRATGLARARFDDTTESGVYRLSLPNGDVYATVAADPRGLDPSPLESAEAAKLAEGWPLTFETDATRLPDHILAGDGKGGRRELWRWLVLAALVSLCVEIYLTRKLVRGMENPV